jgi:hypothetical protein
MELAVSKRFFQFSEKEAAEQARQYAHGQKKSRTAADPMMAVWRKASASYHTMQVGMETSSRTIP